MFLFTAVGSDLERLNYGNRQYTLAVKIQSNSIAYIVLTSATYKSLICNWIGIAHNCYVLKGKDLKNCMRSFDANDIFVIEKESNDEKISLTFQ